MECQACVMKVGKELAGVPGVAHVAVDLKSQRAVVTCAREVPAGPRGRRRGGVRPGWKRRRSAPQRASASLGSVGASSNHATMKPSPLS